MQKNANLHLNANFKRLKSKNEIKYFGHQHCTEAKVSPFITSPFECLNIQSGHNKPR